MRVVCERQEMRIEPETATDQLFLERFFRWKYVEADVPECWEKCLDSVECNPRILPKDACLLKEWERDTNGFDVLIPRPGPKE